MNIYIILFTLSISHSPYYFQRGPKTLILHSFHFIGLAKSLKSKNKYSNKISKYAFLELMTLTNDFTK